MKKLNIRIFATSGELLKTVDWDNVDETRHVVGGATVKLFCADDYIGLSCQYDSHGGVNPGWRNQPAVLENYNRVDLMRRALEGDYMDEQKHLIEKYIKETFHDDEYLRCAQSQQLICYNNNLIQVFGVFGGYARQLLATDNADCAFIPVILNGQCLAREFTGDEGSAGGVAHLFYPKKKTRWSVIELSWLPWLHVDELSMTKDQISDRIVSEVMAGQNVWFPVPAGWA